MNKKYSYIKIGLASPEEIRSWSHGEVKKHETINYRTLKPEEDGLFCEKIFGPTKDYQCACGKTKRNQDKGSVCEKCGVEITESKVRRERMGHIELAAPVVHTWYLKNSPSRLAILLDIKAKDLEEVVYLASYVVIDPGDTGLAKKQTINESTYSELYEKYGNSFKALTGAEAVKELLKNLDLEKERNILRKKLKSKSKQKLEKITKRLEVVESFIESDNKPEWMVLDVLPVIPPDLRPMVQLDGGRFATTDLNDLYRRILNRNNRLKKQKEQNAPHLIIKNEKRMLQEAVDTLIDSSKRGKRGAGDKTKQPKSLSDMLRGKQGRFRQNLLGKRVDYSARSVIVIGPSLKMYQCGIPREMAVTLFKPFIIRELMKSHDVVMGNAKKMIEKGDDKVWEVLDKVIREHPVLLNRAPTLHRLGIQAFEPVLVEGKAIRLHPLVTTAFNADFDGDQMAVHVPLSYEAQAEARLLMLASNNILNPKDGKPIVTPSQDMVLGNYYLTMEKAYNNDGVIDEAQVLEGHVFSGYDEAYMAYRNNEITLHTRIAVPLSSIDREFVGLEDDDMYLLTTLGKMIFNNNIPKAFPYINEPEGANITKGTPRKYIVKKGVNIKELYAKTPIVDPFKKKFLQKIIAEVFKRYQFTETSRMLDRIKDLGFFYSTVSGITISAFDVQVYSKKKEELAKAEAKVDMINGLYENYGVITDRERYKLVTDEWERVRKFIEKDLQKELKKDNHIFMMKDSGARGNDSNFSQLAGMRGLMNNPEGDVIEVPIKGSFREGITGTEYFISTHGARKGSTDTALKTAESGYLTRRLVDVAQDVIVSEVDCKTERGLLFEDITDDSGKVVAKMSERIIGRTASKDIVNPETGEIIVKRNEEISNDKAAKIENAGITGVYVRTALTCCAANGVCMKCYGRNLSTNLTVEVGEAIGTIAAQSIGEPGTQLTMRTFHTGGVASAADITQGLPRVQELFEARNPKGKTPISEIHGILKDIQPLKSNFVMIIEGTDADEGVEKKYIVDGKSEKLFQIGEKIERGQKLVKGSVAPKELLRASYTEDVQKYILEEVLKVYQAQGVEIGDKHIEIIIRQMMRKVVVDIEGDTELLPRSEASINEFKEQVKAVLAKGGKLPVAKPIVLGITRASLRSDSFLSAASFQETTRILTDAAIKSKKDPLLGLKENVIIGGLIPAGTGKLDHEYYNAPQAPVVEEEESEDDNCNSEANELFEEMTQGDDAEAFVVETATNDLD